MSTSIEVDGWKANIRFSSSHILPGHPKCGYLHGHTYAIHSWIYGEKNEKGFIVDFSLLKSTLKEIADKLDHRVLIPKKNDYVSVTKNEIRISTDKELCYRLKKKNPDKIFYPLKSALCPNMKKITLEKVLKSMESLEPTVELSKVILQKAGLPLQRMMEIGRGD